MASKIKIDQYVLGKHIRSTLWPALGKIEDNKIYKVALKETNKRSIPQNDISHAWYDLISRFLGDRTPLEAKCESKAWCGVPILLAEDQDYREQYESMIKSRFTVEEKLKIMEWYPVTSVMEKDQFSQYLESMREYWGRIGVQLFYPEEMQRSSYPEAV